MNHCLKFPNQSTANSILLDGETPRYRNIDTIGVIYKATGATLTSEDGTEYPEMQVLEGWHVNVWVLPEEDATPLRPYVIAPETTTRGWGQAKPITTEQLQQTIVAATQQRLDNFARTRNYDSILSACTYATSTVPKFQVEGQYCVNARDDTWATLYQLFNDVTNGIKGMPTSFANVEPLLPPLEWPN